MFESCGVKVARACDLLNELNALVAEYMAQNPITAVHDKANEPRRWVVRAVVREYPDPVFGIMTGEIVHHLRSALDYAIGELIQYGTGRVPRIEDRFEFPVFRDKRAYRKASTKIDGVPTAAAAAIERLQPFNSDQPEITSIWLLHRMNIADKHRSLHVVAAASLITSITATELKTNRKYVMPATGRPLHAIDLKDGAEILRYSVPGLGQGKIEFDIAMGLAFSSPPEARGHSIFNLLRLLIGQTETFLEALADSVGQPYTRRYQSA